MSCSGKSNDEYEDLPKYWDMLTDDEKNGYTALRREIRNTVSISGRSRFCKVFRDIVTRMEKYINSDGNASSKKSLVCGIIRIGDLFALNTRQLTALIGKCKSSINAGFQSIGYVTVPMETAAAVKLASIYPFMRSSLVETRQWTLRRLASTVISKPKYLQPINVGIVERCDGRGVTASEISTLEEGRADFVDFIDEVDESAFNFCDDGEYFNTSFLF